MSTFLRTDQRLSFFPMLGLKTDLKWLWKQRKLAHWLKDPNSTFFRIDCESALNHTGSKNFDLSNLIKAPKNKKKGREDLEHRQRVCTARAMLRQISQVAQVRTDRLHVSISGAILGKPTTLYSGSYFKNQAIYEHSIQGNYPNVSFSESNNWPEGD